MELEVKTHNGYLVDHREVKGRQGQVSALLAEFKQCSRKGDLEEGRRLHLQAVEAGYLTKNYVANALITMYSRCGSIQDARYVFDSMLRHDVVSWTSLIQGYVENGESSVAMELFASMDCEPNSVTYVAALKACSSLATGRKHYCLEKGTAIHMQAKERGFDMDLYLANNLVDMYSKCGSMWCARDVFDSMPRWDVVSWTTLMLGYVENGQYLVAMELFESMNCEPNSVTYVAALKACAGLCCLEKGVLLHREAREHGFDTDIFVASTLIEMYAKCGSMSHAQEAFNSMGHRNAVSWTSLIMGYVENGESLRALDLFTSMNCEQDSITFVAAIKACTSLASERHICLEKGMSLHKQAKEKGFLEHIVVASSLIEMYSKCRSMRNAQDVFDKMMNRNAVSWTSLILGYVENGESSTALDMFMSMDSEPDSVTFVAVLKACGVLVALADGHRVHSHICKLGLEEDQVVENALVDFYGKCGVANGAQHLFDTMPVTDVFSWNALVAGYVSVGETPRVFDVVRKMFESGTRMDGITFTSVLTVCSRSGKVEEGNKWFEYMSRCGIRPTVEHYTCMVDMLGRVNRLQEALSIIRNMPFEPTGVVWKALLGACKNWNNTEVGKIAFDALVTCNKEDGAAYVLMGNVYKNTRFENMP